jgi:hypothetical protein
VPDIEGMKSDELKRVPRWTRFWSALGGVILGSAFWLIPLGGRLWTKDGVIGNGTSAVRGHLDLLPPNHGCESSKLGAWWQFRSVSEAPDSQGRFRRSPLAPALAVFQLPNPHAISSARRTSGHRVSDRLHNTGPIRLRCARTRDRNSARTPPASRHPPSRSPQSPVLELFA